MDAAGIKQFAAEFDPQPFHLDEEAAKASLFAGLAASGWHTAGMTMRLIVEGPFRPAGGVIGAGIDEFRWPKPVRPGDVLRVVSEVIESRESKSRPTIGIVRVRHTTLFRSDATFRRGLIQVKRLRVELRGKLFDASRIHGISLRSEAQIGRAHV